MQFLVTVAVLVTAPPSGGAAARRGAATAALVAAERARGASDVVVNPLAMLAAGWTAERNLAFFGRGAALVAEGRRALERVELDEAEKRLGEAEAVYAPELGRPGVAAEWAEAATWHGVALFELKRRDEAAEAWGRAKALFTDTLLTEAMVRPEVARAFAAAPVGARPAAPAAATPGLADVPAALGVDELVVAAIAIDAGVLTYAAARRQAACGTDTLTATSADELVRRLEAAPCRAGAPLAVQAAPAIAHPRAGAGAGARAERARRRRAGGRGVAQAVAVGRRRRRARGRRGAGGEPVAARAELLFDHAVRLLRARWAMRRLALISALLVAAPAVGAADPPAWMPAQPRGPTRAQLEQAKKLKHEAAAFGSIGLVLFAGGIAVNVVALDVPQGDDDDAAGRRQPGREAQRSATPTGPSSPAASRSWRPGSRWSALSICPAQAGAPAIEPRRSATRRRAWARRAGRRCGGSRGRARSAR